MKKSEKLAFIAAGIGAAFAAGTNFYLGSSIWPWYVLAILWAICASPTYTILLAFAALDRAVDKE